MKRCRRCDMDKELSMFSREKRNADGLTSYCKKCNSERTMAWRKANPERWTETRRYQDGRYNAKRRAGHLRRRYGITQEVYDCLLLAQGGKCEICRTYNPGGRGSYFHVDHDHSTGAVRALLCGKCNHAIGLLRDDPEVAFSAYEYLAKHKQILRAA